MTLLVRDSAQKFFKQAMMDQRVAHEFFEAHLPAKFLKEIDLTTLMLETYSFVDEAYKATETDVVYRVHAGKNMAYLCIIYKSESEVSDPMSFRLLQYKVRIMEMHHTQFPKSPLPIVFPIVIHR